MAVDTTSAYGYDRNNLPDPEANGLMADFIGGEPVRERGFTNEPAPTGSFSMMNHKGGLPAVPSQPQPQPPTQAASQRGQPLDPGA